jgi:peptidoglycan hydrolase CwlO-like protein
MNKGILIGIGIIGGFTIAAGTFAAIVNAKVREVPKQISNETGIPYEEVKAAFKEFDKKIRKMRKNKATQEELMAATEAFYKELDRKAAA